MILYMVLCSWILFRRWRRNARQKVAPSSFSQTGGSIRWPHFSTCRWSFMFHSSRNSESHSNKINIIPRCDQGSSQKGVEICLKFMSTTKVQTDRSKAVAKAPNRAQPLHQPVSCAQQLCACMHLPYASLSLSFSLNMSLAGSPCISGGFLGTKPLGCDAWMGH